MSTNFVSYENAEDLFEGYAARIKANTEFVGTQAEWDALSAEDKAKYILVNITDDNSSVGGEKEVINGYYNSADGKFYIDSSYTTEIVPDSACIYVDLNENKMYRYDSLTLQYVVMSGGGGADYVAGYGIKIDDDTHEISTKTFVGTQAEWDNLTSAQKAKFDTVNITDDATPVNYEPGHAIVDSTGTEAPQRNNLKFDGMTVTDDSTNDTTVVAPIPYTAGDKITITDHEIAVDETVTTTFTGTRAEWDTLSATEKAAYNIVNLTDDPAGSGMVVVDVIQNGNMNAVTSNAVSAAAGEFTFTEQSFTTTSLNVWEDTGITVHVPPVDDKKVVYSIFVTDMHQYVRPDGIALVIYDRRYTRPTAPSNQSSTFYSTGGIISAQMVMYDNPYSMYTVYSDIAIFVKRSAGSGANTITVALRKQVF